jgi:hypothetical protein
VIRPVSYTEILDAPNSAELMAEYAAECSLPELGMPNPQRALYELLEKSGGFQAFGVYDERTLVGFASVLDYVLPHYGKKIAATESLFLGSGYRSKGLPGLHLLDSMQDYAKTQGCGHMLYSAPVGSRFDKMMTLFDNYRHTNNIYLRTI